MWENLRDGFILGDDALLEQIDSNFDCSSASALAIPALKIKTD